MVGKNEGEVTIHHVHQKVAKGNQVISTTLGDVVHRVHTCENKTPHEKLHPLQFDVVTIFVLVRLRNSKVDQSNFMKLSVFCVTH